MSIQKGNVFYVPAAYLGGDQGKKVTVKWSQMMSSRSEDYWICKYTNKTTNSCVLKTPRSFATDLAKLISSIAEENLIFVQASKLDEFKNRKIDGDALTFKVDDSFQYGQKKDGSKRFLVYHDKNNKPYQVTLPPHHHQFHRILS